jgi:TRAP-type C4-dicarboxylate transport system permease small subunit
LAKFFRETNCTVKIISDLSRFMGYIATCVLGLMMLLTVADVFMRYAFNSPITGTMEVSEFMMVIVGFLALAWCAVRYSHVKVDLVLSNFSPRVQAIVDSITMLAALGTYVVITWRSFLESMDVDTTASLLRVPHSPFYWVLTFGFFLLCLALVALIIENVTKAIKR